MASQILELNASSWRLPAANPAWISALEAGRVLYFPRLAFALQGEETRLLTPAVLDPKARNISLGLDGRLKGAHGEPPGLAAMMARFREQATTLIHSLVPDYRPWLRLAPLSFRPMAVETRVQSWRADDRRLHIDAFPSRPNYGERILRVFANVNGQGVPRVWRIGEPFADVARRFLPRAKPFSRWQARLLYAAGITKAERSEYDHLMLQLHDGMKGDASYQQNSPQMTMPFPPGSVWVCFSDQTSHAVTGGQYLLEQTLHLPAERQYDFSASPLAILSRLTERDLLHGRRAAAATI